MGIRLNRSFLKELWPMRSLHSKLLGMALFIALVGTPLSVVRGNAAANSSNAKDQAAKKSHSSQLMESAVLVLVGAGLMTGAIVLRKVIPTHQ
jgi:hypothetical protein